MDEKQQKVLQKCHHYLIQNIRPLPLIDSLYSCGILTSDDSIRLQKEVTPNDQNRLLLVSMLPKAGPTAFSSLLTALKETGHSHVADYLLEELRLGTCMQIHSEDVMCSINKLQYFNCRT